MREVPTAKALIAIRDDIDAARRLIECGWMAAQNLNENEQGALSELLDAVKDRLTATVDELQQRFLDT